MTRQELDDKLLVAMRVARQHHLSIWNAALEEHRRHPTFRVQTWPYTLEYGFTCECSGHEEEWRIRVHALKEMLPAARESLMRVYRQHIRAGTKLQRRERAKAEMCAKALLHRHLTKEQRIELRRTRAFTMRGKDGRTYHVTLGSCTNIILEHEGVKYVLCVVPKDWLPNHDTLLAQKIMLETDPEAFLRMAKVRNTVTNEYYESGDFLLGEPPKVRSKLVPVEVLPLTEEQLENPREWVETRIGEPRDA